MKRRIKKSEDVPETRYLVGYKEEIKVERLRMVVKMYRFMAGNLFVLFSFLEGSGRQRKV